LRRGNKSHGAAAHSAAKGGLIALTRQVAAGYADRLLDAGID
jgi:hypothetical protein